MEQNHKRLILQSNKEMNIRGDLEVLTMLDYGKIGINKFIENIQQHFPKESNDIINIISSSKIIGNRRPLSNS